MNRKRKHREREDPTRIFQTKAKEQRKVRFGLPNHSERLTDPWIGKAQNETLILELRKENGKNLTDSFQIEFLPKGPNSTSLSASTSHKIYKEKNRQGKSRHRAASPREQRPGQRRKGHSTAARSTSSERARWRGTLRRRRHSVVVASVAVKMG
jgi:hypothetical protein